MRNELAQDSLAATAAKVAPSLTVVGATIFGLTIPDVAALLGGVFILMQMAYLVWKWRREAKRK